MNQLNEHFSSIKPPIRANKNFVYKGKKYPVDFCLVKKYSNYFYNNRNQYKAIEDIEISSDNLSIEEQSISMFISFCQNEPFDINDSNIFSLHQLSIRYEVPILNKLTTHYIVKNKKSLVFQTIFYKLQNQNAKVNFDLSPEEEIISSNFFDYVNDDQLYSLPVSVLYHIVNSEHMKINSLDSIKQGQFIDFLFKCLDIHKREASVLFLNLDLENERIDLLSQLLSRYSDVFDFGMLNSKFLAKNTSHLLSEIQKLKIEYTNQLFEMKTENEKQKEIFKTSQKNFDDSKSEMLNSNQKLEERIANLENELANQKRSNQQQLALIEEKLNEQERKLERYTNIKVNDIQINAEPKFLLPDSTMNLSVSVKPKFAFNDDVEWQIFQEIEGTVEVVSKNEKSLVLKGLIAGKKITVVAKAIDGSGVTATKEITVGMLNVEIDVNVQQGQFIKGTIKTTEVGGIKLDKSKSKFIVDTSSSANLGSSAYESGFQLDSLNKEVSLEKAKGKYYLHVFVVDNYGSSKELVSQILEIKFVQPLCFSCTGNVQSVQLEPGSYKLEAWGAQGGSLNSTYHGGFGGYSTGTINLQSKTTLYVVVGKSASTEVGGYNGGGSGGIYNGFSYKFASYGGGGATHIGLKSGELRTFASDYESNLLIADGGGGGATDGTKYPSRDNKSWCGIGGCGGGFAGSDGIFEADNGRIGRGATQSAGGCFYQCGEFGQGANYGNAPGGHYGAGGGGGFYGGGSGDNSGPGGGGSGYINTSKLTDSSMFGYNIPTSSSVESKTFSTTNVSSDATSNFAKQGDGYVKITPI